LIAALCLAESSKSGLALHNYGSIVPAGPTSAMSDAVSSTHELLEQFSKVVWFPFVLGMKHTPIIGG